LLKLNFLKIIQFKNKRLHFKVSLDKTKDAEPSFVRYVDQYVNVTYTFNQRMWWKDCSLSLSFVYIDLFFLSMFVVPSVRLLNILPTSLVCLLYLYCCHLRSWHRHTQKRMKKKILFLFDIFVYVFISPFHDEKKRPRRKTNGKYKVNKTNARSIRVTG